jgi:hypothetical protein
MNDVEPPLDRFLPSPPSPTIFGKEIVISGCGDSAKFALITRQNSLTPPTPFEEA